MISARVGLRRQWSTAPGVCQPEPWAGDAAGAALCSACKPPPHVSIITVVRNAQADIARTIESVAAQQDASYEYIVVDGASADATVKVLRDYRFHIDQLVSEADRGIYDAMMKGAHMARGEWVIFLGAGDRFVHDRVLAQFDPPPDVQLAYGSFYWERPDRCWHVPTKPLHELWKSICFSHQSLFCRRQVILELGFSRSFLIAGDYDFYARAITDGYRIIDLGRPISVAQAGGISGASFFRRTIERFAVARRLYPDKPVLSYYASLILQHIFKNVRHGLRDRIVTKRRKRGYR
jgi:putative colanic acid biosynthesis glycosyltransferase